jgi:hypothetical protein
VDHLAGAIRPLLGRLVGILTAAATTHERPKDTKDPMDKKAKKRLEVIKKKLDTLRPRLAGSREQDDDLSETQQLEDEIAALEAEAKEIRGK